MVKDNNTLEKMFRSYIHQGGGTHIVQVFWKVLVPEEKELR